MKILHAIFSSASLVLFRVVVDCWILRLPCKSEGVFSVRVRGSALQGSVLRSNTASSLQHCFGMCIHSPLCKSVNFKESDVICELSGSRKETASQHLFVNKEGWTYYTTDTTSVNVGSYCSLQKPCPPREVCVDRCHCPSYHCSSQCALGYRRNPLMKCEKENIAFSKPASLSSNYGNRSSASFLVDGDKSIHLLKCTETQEENMAWVMVDLQRRILVKEVILYLPLPDDRNMGYFDVRFGDHSDNGGLSNLACATFIDPKKEVERVVCPEGTVGRYVTVNTSGFSFIEICEVEVTEK